jgi:hypothetical protein
LSQHLRGGPEFSVVARLNRKGRQEVRGFDQLVKRRIDSEQRENSL